MAEAIKEQIKKKIKSKATKIPKVARIIKPKLKILRVIKTRGTHSWVETDKGVFRKENKNIPVKLFQR